MLSTIKWVLVAVLTPVGWATVGLQNQSFAQTVSFSEGRHEVAHSSDRHRRPPMRPAPPRRPGPPARPAPPRRPGPPARPAPRPRPAPPRAQHIACYAENNFRDSYVAYGQARFEYQVRQEALNRCWSQRYGARYYNCWNTGCYRH